MNPADTTIVFTTLAMNQTLFFAALGNSLKVRGYKTAYVAFHERSYELLRARGERVYNAFAPKPDYLQKVDLQRYPWASLNLILSHEKAAFEISDSQCLIRKLCRYLAVMEQVFDELQSDSQRIILVQELGGFLSIIAAFYAARARSIDNFFIEPSFFRGRVFIVRNSFAAFPVEGPVSSSVSPEVTAYLDEAQAKRSIVIPTKDHHHYRGAWRKLADGRNWGRLIQKVADKYLFGKREEFGHVGGHVRRHMRMWANSRRLKRHYRSLPANGRFIYYPLHVPADAALTLRTPEYLDQYALIDYLCRVSPATHKVVIKEHPALVGAVELQRVRELLKRRDNLILLDPAINNYEVLGRADAVITVNSKSGAEGLFLGRPIIVLGDAFYTPCRLVSRPKNLSGLPALLAELIGRPPPVNADEIRRYFQDVWDHSYRGEIFDASPNNVDGFCESLSEVMECS